jgi:hypothetical protein
MVQVKTKNYNNNVSHGYQSFGLHTNDRRSQQQGTNQSQANATTTTAKPLHQMNDTQTTPTISSNTSNGLEPYISRLERFELYSTNQCYYLIGCNKQSTAYRVIKMDRTLIERPPDYIIQQQQQQRYNGGEFYGMSHQQQQQQSPRYGPFNPGMDQSKYHSSTNSTSSIATSAISGIVGDPANNTQQQQQQQQQQQDGNSHTVKPTLRPLTDFLIEDPNVYTQEEINDMLDMIYDGNRTTALQQLPGHLTDRTYDNNQQQSNNNNNTTPGLKPIVKAYGIVGFIRFLDCYYITLITRRAKVGTIGGNPIFTIKVSHTVASVRIYCF